jgi:predicted esterase YcpF (UPF0227 family)
MNILNLHGYKGNSENTMFRILEELFPEANIYSPSHNYDRTPYHIAMNTASYLCGDLDLVVGTSLGGFFALNLCAEYSLKCPCIVFNPALHPWEVLPKLGYDKAENLAEFKALYNKNFAKIKNLEKLLVLSGKDDDVVGNLSEEPQLQSRIKRINCGHSANGNAEAISKIKREITSWLT